MIRVEREGMDIADEGEIQETAQGESEENIKKAKEAIEAGKKVGEEAEKESN